MPMFKINVSKELISPNIIKTIPMINVEKQIFVINKSLNPILPKTFFSSRTCKKTQLRLEIAIPTIPIR